MVRSSESKIKNDKRKVNARREARNAFNVLDYVGHCHNALLKKNNTTDYYSSKPFPTSTMSGDRECVCVLQQRNLLI